MPTSTVPSQTMTSSEVPLVKGDVLRSTITPTVVSPVTRSSSVSAADIAGIDLSAIGKAEARKIMSEEHRALGFRPPQGSLAAKAQAAAARHPEGKPNATPPDTLKLKALAREDAERILAERKMNMEANASAASDAHGKSAAVKHSPTTGGVNLNTIGAAEARTLMSHQHRALGFRPPPGSLAAEAQAAAARHPEGDGNSVDEEVLKAIALKDVERIKADRELNAVGEVNASTLAKVTHAAGAAPITSAAEEALDHRPEASSGSLLSEAERAARAHPEGEQLRENKEKITAIYTKKQQDQANLNSEEATIQQNMEETTAKHSTEKIVANGLGSILRSAVMVRTETEDSVQIVGDVVG